MRGVLLAGGKGTRLGELTRVTNKHLLPVGQYPMIYHPLKKMVEAGIRDILLVTGKEHAGDFIELLGTGGGFGCRLTYRVQEGAGGIGQALGLAEEFCVGNRCVVVLGDNVFQDPLAQYTQCVKPENALVVLKHVSDAGRYGVAEIDRGELVGIEEKPAKPKSGFAVTGIYAYPPNVFDVIRTLKPSGRGELEITDVNNYYLREHRLQYCIMDGYWTDAGTFESLAEANRLVSGK